MLTAELTEKGGFGKAEEKAVGKLNFGKAKWKFRLYSWEDVLFGNY